MKLERIRPTVFQATLHAYELAALMAGARWIAEGAEGELLPDAREHLRAIVANYDAEMGRAAGPGSVESSDRLTSNGG